LAYLYYESVQRWMRGLKRSSRRKTDLDKAVNRLGDFFNWLQGREVKGYESRSIVVDRLNRMRM